MSIALDIFCFAVPYMMLFAAVFSAATGIGGCWWPIYDRSVLVTVDFLQLSNNTLNSAYMANSMTFLIMIHSICDGSFLEALIVSVCWILAL